MLTPWTRRTPGSTLTSVRRYVRARMTALDEVTQVPWGLRFMTLMLTSSHAGAIPDSFSTWARWMYPPSPGSRDSATRGCLPSGVQPVMMPATRSEERRVGKECRWRWSRDDVKDRQDA